MRVADLSAYSDGLRSTDLEKAPVLCRELLIVEIAAESSELRLEARASARCRAVDVVACISHARQRDTARRAEVRIAPRLPCWRAAIALISAALMLFIAVLAIAQRDGVRCILIDGTAQGDLTARVPAHVFFLQVAVRIIVVVLIGAVVDTQRSRCFLAVKPRTSIREDEAVRICIIAAHLVEKTHGVARAPEIRIADIDHADEAVRRTVAGTNAKVARAFFDDVRFKDDGSRLLPGIELHVHVLEEAEVVDALHAAASLLHVERLTDLQTHLAQDDAILRLRIALDSESFKLSLIDLEREVSCSIDIHVLDLGEDETVRPVLFLHGRDVLLQFAAVQNLAWLKRDELFEILRRLNRIPLDPHGMKHGVFQDMIRENDALGHILPRWVEVVKIACIEDGGAVALRLLSIIHIAHALHEGSARRRHRILARAVDDNVDDGLAVGDLRLLVNFALLGAIGFPRLNARILHLCLGGSAFSNSLRIHAPDFFGICSGVLHFLIALHRTHDSDGRRGVCGKAGKARSKCDGPGEDSRSLHIQVFNLLCFTSPLLYHECPRGQGGRKVLTADSSNYRNHKNHSRSTRPAVTMSSCMSSVGGEATGTCFVFSVCCSKAGCG